MSGQGVIGDGLEPPMSGCQEVGSCVQGRRLCGSKAIGCPGAAAGCGCRATGNKAEGEQGLGVLALFQADSCSERGIIVAGIVPVVGS